MSSFFAPNALQMFDAPLHFFDRQGRVKFKNFNVLRFHERLQCSVIDHARARRTVVASGKKDVMNMEPKEPWRQRLEMNGVIDETEVLLDLRMAAIVPIA